MIKMPDEFVATKYPGYFWNVNTQTLFTAKLGVLRELKYEGPNRWNHGLEGYRVSHQGVKRVLHLNYLRKLKPKDSVFPVQYKLEFDGTQGKTVNFRDLPKGTVVTIRVN